MLFSLPCVRLADPPCRAVRRATWSLALGLGLVILTALAPAARAADTAWTGATSSAWSTAGNWSAGVPTSADSAQLLSGQPNSSISLAGANAANQLQVWSGATYTLTSSAPATLTLSDQLYVFSDPTASALTLGGSLSVSAPNGSIGTGAGDVGGTLTVASGASLSVANTFNVGYDGKLNQLQVTGGTFTAKDLFVAGGTVTSFSNSVTVNGGALSATNSLVVGALGTSNLLTGASGSIIVTGTGGAEVGKDVTADYNVINLTGASFSATNSLIVGRDGDHNEFNVTDGSVATTGQARIGLNATGDYNKVLVSGSGSQWTANGTVRVGSDGDHNELIIANGGRGEEPVDRLHRLERQQPRQSGGPREHAQRDRRGERGGGQWFDVGE
ncbi:MAG: hypothetical protein EBR86_15920 [Planctomycetia bacterium]|nr:hypothetical protein [Planctomycetia bacterium]